MPRKPRRSFRRRLLLTLGSALATTFVVLGLLAWAFTYGWLLRDAHTVLAHEAQEVASQVVTPSGFLRPQRYAWYEAHHRYAAPRIDPFFIQVFNADGTLLRTSENIGAFAASVYPDTLVHRMPHSTEWYTPLDIRNVQNIDLYFHVEPIADRQGRTIGYVQAARIAPGLAAQMRQVGLLIAGVLGGLLLALLGLTWAIARRVLQPLQTITEATHQITSANLSQRIPITDGFDEETAQLAQTLNTLLARLEGAFEEMKRFTDNAAHEIQTPLTILRGHVDIALRRERTPESYQQTLTLLGDEIDHLVRMVRSLLALARLDRATPMQQEQLDWAALVRTEIATFMPRAEQQDLRLTADLPEHVIVNGQPDLLREVIVNLLDNALKYTDEGSVAVRLATDERHATLTVTDTGCGIAPEDLPHVTDRFFRASTAKAEAPGGHGLGLALVHRIVHLHNGSLEIAAQPGTGTTVTVALPRVSDGPSASSTNLSSTSHQRSSKLAVS